ncbi:hypothetical protein BDW67DRAFT_161919 [Aspergillus spinulosporus]
MPIAAFWCHATVGQAITSLWILGLGTPVPVSWVSSTSGRRQFLCYSLPAAVHCNDNTHFRL